MLPLPIFQLPLPPRGPPLGYDYGERDISVSSSSTAFKEALYERDVFFGLPRCVICGDSTEIYNEAWPIVRELHPWTDLKERGWIPPHAKAHPTHEPRNSLVMCISHRTAFKAHRFFIRFFPSCQKYVFINYSGADKLQPFHGKAIALSIADHHAPFPALFIIHEMRIRGYWPFRPVAPLIPHDIPWQDWITAAGAVDEAEAFRREFPACGDTLPQPARRDAGAGVAPGAGAGGGMGMDTAPPPPQPERGRPLPELDRQGVDDILLVQKKMPAWKACQREGTTWTGTADENTHKYVSTIGADDRQHGSESPKEKNKEMDIAKN